MNTKIRIILFSLLFVSISFGQLGYVSHHIAFFDEMHRKVTDVTSVNILVTDTATSQSVYQTKIGGTEITVPLTTSSTNTTLSGNTCWWYGADRFELTVISTSLGTVTYNNLNSSVGEILILTFMPQLSSLSTTDAQNITMGTDSDWVFNAGTTDDLFTGTPATDGAVFRIGLADGTKSADLQWYTGNGVGLIIDEGANTFGLTGLTANINAASNFATNINTGTSTGAVTIGSATAGAIIVDTTSTIAVNSDGAIDITTTDASADITLDSTAGSVIIDGGQAADDAVVISATGTGAGIDITSLGDVDITTTGTAGEDITLTNTGGSINLSATEDIATAIVISASTGGIDITADGAAASDLDLDCTNGSVNITSGESAADSIVISSTLGGIDISAVGAAAGEDIDITTTGSSINITATEDDSAALVIEVDGGTSEGLTLHSDQGTGDESILLSSDVGGVTINAAAGSIDIEAVGGSDGDIGINAGDDLTITAAGNTTFAVTGTLGFGGSILTNIGSVTEVLATADTLTASQSGSMFIHTAGSAVTLPEATSAEVGVYFYIIDANSTAGADVSIDPEGAGTIDGDGAGDKITNETDALGCGCLIICTAADTWYTMMMPSAWTQE